MTDFVKLPNNASNKTAFCFVSQGCYNFTVDKNDYKLLNIENITFFVVEKEVVWGWNTSLAVFWDKNTAY